MDILDEWLYYDETSPTCLRWKKDKFVGKYFNVHRLIKDSPAGHRGQRRCALMLENIRYAVHHVVWWLVHRETVGDKIIDHIDGNPFNNQVSNLRLVDPALNARNMKKSKLNTSGVTGVNLHQNKYWRVTWYEDGKLMCKYFPIHKEESFEQAVKYREEKIKELNEAGYGYSQRHGK